MIKDIVQFLRIGPEITRLQRHRARAEFVDVQNAMVDAQGFSEVRRELVGDLTGRVLEIGCGRGTMFEYYGDGVELDAIEPEHDFLAIAATKVARAAARVQAVAGDGTNLAFQTVALMPSFSVSCCAASRLWEGPRRCLPRVTGRWSLARTRPRPKPAADCRSS
jgi:SAM-dependent methyltransferase